MQHYGNNKLRTAWQMLRQIENWPTAWGLRLFRQRAGLRLLAFRNGLNVLCRGGTRDWDVIHELGFAGGYARAFAWLGAQPGRPVVLDLGGNIGLFSLLAATAHPQARVVAYEPGPPNARVFELNRIANERLADRIELRREAVGGATREAEWFFDAQNPGGSGLFQNSGVPFTVQIRAFSEVLAALPGPVALVKMDIEGAEFEVLAQTPADAWKQVGALALELHDDPASRTSRDQFLLRLEALGFTVEEESVCTLFLHRTATA